MATLNEQIVADLGAFMDTVHGFAREIKFTGTTGPYTIKGIFDKTSLMINDYTGEGAAPSYTIIAKTSDLDLAGAKPHDKAYIDNDVFEVLTISDDHGLSTLTLNWLRTD